VVAHNANSLEEGQDCRHLLVEDFAKGNLALVAKTANGKVGARAVGGDRAVGRFVELLNNGGDRQCSGSPSEGADISEVGLIKFLESHILVASARASTSVLFFLSRLGRGRLALRALGLDLGGRVLQ